MPPARVLLVTGMSGAGRSTALKVLEDLGYETFDNLPAALVPALIDSAAADGPAIAVGADARTRGFAAETMFEPLADIVGRSGRRLGVLFIDCDDVRLERRYTETRRPHPLAGDRPIMDGIRRERQVVSALRDRADLVIDTSDLTAADLKRLLTGHFALDHRGMRIFVTSFAYRTGIPREADLIFDVRFLDNPHYVEALRGLTGCDPAVAAHIESDPDFAPFFARLWRLLRPLLPRYEIEGRPILPSPSAAPAVATVRSYVAERLAARLREAGWRTEIAHRDLSSTRPGRADPGGRIRRRRLSAAAGSSRGNPMIGMVLVTHGRLAAEFVAALEHVVGAQTQIAAVCIGPDDDMEQRRQEILLRIAEVDSGNGAVLLTDMFGGTPSNLAISVMDRAKIEVIAGVNLPMLIKLASLRQSESLERTVLGAQEAGRKYINVASQLLTDACR